MNSDLCFNKGNRLTKPSQFGNVYSNNDIRVKGRYFLVLVFSCLTDCTNTKPRVGVVCSKKVSKLAVTRNKIKRLMRENFRKAKPEQSFDFIIIARIGISKIANKELNKDLEYIWKKVNKKCNLSSSN